MKQTFRKYLIITFLFSINIVSAQTKEVSFLIDTCITIMKENSVASDKVDWNQLRKNAISKASGINDAYKLGPAMRYLYQSVNDFHGAFFYKDSSFKWQRKQPVVSDSIMNEWKKGITVKSVLLDNNVGYLRVPYMSYNGKEDADKNAQKLNDTLCWLLEKNVNGIVLDLRLNGGGAMFPMMLGLKQLLGDGKLGKFISKKSETWNLKHNNFLLDTTILTSIAPKCSIKAEMLPLVSLIGSSTGSSGEFLVMAFKGRKNTLLLGTETAGYITAVAGFPVNDAAYMYLSTGYGADRDGQVYKEAISPDINIDSPDSFNDIKNDKKVNAAINWIINQSK